MNRKEELEKKINDAKGSLASQSLPDKFRPNIQAKMEKFQTELDGLKDGEPSPAPKPTPPPTPTPKPNAPAQPKAKKAAAPKSGPKPAPAPADKGKTFVWMEKVKDWEKATKPITLSNDFRMMEVEDDGYIELRGVKTPIKKGDVLLVNHLGYPVTFFTPGSTKAHVKPFKELVSEERLDNLNAELVKAENKLAEKTKEIAELKKQLADKPKPAPAPKDDDKPAPAKPKPAPKDDDKPAPKPHDCDADPKDVEDGDLPTAVETWLDGMADGWKERKIHEKVDRIYHIKKTNKIVVKLVHYDPLLRKIGTSVKSVANPDFYFLCVETAKLTKTTKPEKGSFTVLHGDDELKEVYSTNRNWNACSKLAKAAYEACGDGECSEEERKKYKKMYYDCGDTEQKRKNREMLQFLHSETRKEWKKKEEGYYTAFRRTVSKLKKDAAVKWPA